MNLDTTGCCILTTFVILRRVHSQLLRHLNSSNRVLTTLENWEISGNLLILENSGHLKFTQGIYLMLFFVCIIVSNSTLNWLGDAVTGVDGAILHAS